MLFKKYSVAITTLVILLLTSCGEDKDDPELIVDLADLHCIPNNLHNDVVAYYPFPDGALFDYTGNGHDLSTTTTATPQDDRNGNTDDAYSFDGNDLLKLSATEFLNVSQLSISLWYFSTEDESRGGGDFETLIARGAIDDGCDDDEPWSLALYDCKREVFAATGSIWGNLISENEGGFTCDGEMAARSGHWDHIVATINVTTHEMKLYRNGVLQDETTEISGCREWGTIGDLIIGDKFNGAIDDIAIFNRVLTIDEVGSLYDMVACF